MVVVPSSYGKSLKPSDLPDGFARFFPLSSAPDSSSEPPPPPSAPDTAPSSRIGTGTGLPIDLLLVVLEGVRADVEELRAVLQRTELRIVGASLLVIYEADPTWARESLRKMEEAPSEEEEYAPG